MNSITCGKCWRTSYNARDILNSHCPACGLNEDIVRIVLPLRFIRLSAEHETSWFLSYVRLPGPSIVIGFMDQDDIAISCSPTCRSALTEMVQDYIDVVCDPHFRIPDEVRSLYKYTDDQYRIMEEAIHNCIHELNVSRQAHAPQMLAEVWYFAAIECAIRNRLDGQCDDVDALTEAVKLLMMRRLN